MARALVTEPKLMLLDEPLAALDVARRSDVRRYLRTVLHSITTMRSATARRRAGRV